jgi:hypothetical protein
MNKELLYQIATGVIKEPMLELEADGEKRVFQGRDARIFAFGALLGLKISSPETKIKVTDLNAQS